MRRRARAKTRAARAARAPPRSGTVLPARSRPAALRLEALHGERMTVGVGLERERRRIPHRRLERRAQRGADALGAARGELDLLHGERLFHHVAIISP